MTKNELKSTLETSEWKLHSKRANGNYTRNERMETTLETSEWKLHSKRADRNYTRKERNETTLEIRETEPELGKY